MNKHAAIIAPLAPRNAALDSVANLPLSYNQAASQCELHPIHPRKWAPDRKGSLPTMLFENSVVKMRKLQNDALGNA